jgi:hypothetical protein
MTAALKTASKPPHSRNTLKNQTTATALPQKAYEIEINFDEYE